MFAVTDRWRTEHAGASAGILVLHGVANPVQHPQWEERKGELMATLRTRYGSLDRAGLAALPAAAPYVAYYGLFRKTYHVLPQLESVVLKGRALAGGGALVEAMFAAELHDQLLTAGHDLSTLDLPIRVDVAQGDASYTLMNGKEQALAPGDMYMADRRGVISSVVYGPDRRTRITPETSAVAFAVYAPPGIPPEMVHAHLEHIRANVLVFAPEAQTRLLSVHVAAAPEEMTDER
jgi:DNA/RNA-binding domain of Phe-tRNA-synthetase-like protein